MGIVPTRGSLIGLVGRVLAEQDDERRDGRPYFRPETTAVVEAVIAHAGVGGALLMAN